MNISAVVLTKNEENNIERCLRSTLFCNEIVIIDDFSDDKTINIIEKTLSNHKDHKIFKKRLRSDFAEQRNFGMKKAKNDWILFIDADEEVTDELKKEINSLVTNKNKIDNYEAFFIRRRDFFWNKELFYGEVKHVRQIGLVRLVHKDSGKWLGNVHEVFFTSKKTGQLKEFINHYPHKTLKEFIQKINLYSTLRANELFSHSKKTNIVEIIIWPLGKFLYNYFFKLGFLDGPAGFTYAFMMSFHSFLVRAKLYQLMHKLSK